MNDEEATSSRPRSLPQSLSPSLPRSVAQCAPRRPSIVARFRRKSFPRSLSLPALGYRIAPRVDNDRDQEIEFVKHLVKSSRSLHSSHFFHVHSFFGVLGSVLLLLVGELERFTVVTPFAPRSCRSRRNVHRVRAHVTHLRSPRWRRPLYPHIILGPRLSVFVAPFALPHSPPPPSLLSFTLCS